VTKSWKNKHGTTLKRNIVDMALATSASSALITGAADATANVQQ
jgi:hypothetical protein